MTSRRWLPSIAAMGIGLMAAGSGEARAQFARYPSVGGYGGGYGSGNNAFGGVGLNTGLGYGVRTGQYGRGYQSTYGLYGGAYVRPRAQTTTNYQGLIGAITSLPGWSGTTTRRVHHRLLARPTDPPIPHYDHTGRILWPGIVRDDTGSAVQRKEAEDAFLSVYRESKSTGHASIRPVIHAKEKLSAYERRILPDIKGRSVADGDNLERFFVDLDRSLDEMNAAYF